MATKAEELKDGCLSKVADNEPIFVLRGQDATAPYLVRMWATINDPNLTPAYKEVYLQRMLERIKDEVLLHSNKISVRRFAEAYALSHRMEQWSPRKWPD